MRTTFNLLILFLIIFPVSSFSQGNGMDEWRDELPYNNCIALEEAGSRIYSATPYGLFYFDREDNSIQRISKVNGLSDMGISALSYNNETKTLVVAYSNTNIDLITGNSIINISDIKRKQILGYKTINNVYSYGKYAWLACGFGVIVLDLERREIKETCYIGAEGSQVNVLDLIIDTDGTIYAASEKGLYTANVNDPDLANFASWHIDPRIDPNGRYNTITSFAGKIFVNKSSEAFNQDSIYIISGNSSSLWALPVDNDVRRLVTSSNSLIVIYNFFIYRFDTNLNLITNIWSYYPAGCNPSDAFVDQSDQIWIADLFQGLVTYHISKDYFSQVTLNGPSSEKAFSLTANGNNLYVAPGGRDSPWSPLWVNGEIYRFDNSSWKNLNKYTTPGLDSVHDVVVIAVDPSDTRRWYAGSWGSGLVEFYDTTLVQGYDESNSTLKHHSGSPDHGDIRVGGLCFDKDNNLWVTNSHNVTALSMKKPDGTWQAFNISELEESDFSQVIVDDYNQKWIVMRYGNTNPYSLLVFDDNNTTRKVRKLNSSEGNGHIPGNTVLSIANDIEGKIWIGTESGIAVFYTPENVLSGQDFDAQQILVEQDGYVQYLLDNEAVTCITVDGANRKWIGTDRSGVFYLSSDGTTEIHHFTEENSPLLSNRISSIAINELGEVFFATDKGIISFKGSATPGGEKFDKHNVYASPNPVPPDYSGNIKIYGLPGNPDVRITDISGTVVFAQPAISGLEQDKATTMVEWNGRNLNGQKPHSGVYLVFATDPDGTEKVVAKILIIN